MTILSSLHRRIARPTAPRRAAAVRVLAPAELTTARLAIRPLSASDRAEFLRVLRLSRQHLARWFPTTKPGEADAEYFDRQLHRAAESDRDGSAWRRAAFLDNGALAGIVNINRIERGLDWQADCCWWVAADQTRRGLALEMLSAALDHALADLPRGLGLGSIHAGIHPANAPSRLLAQRLGFAPDPALTSRLYVDGDWQTHEAWTLRARVG